MQYTSALHCILFQLFHLLNFLVLDITPVVLMRIQNAYKGIGHSVEVQCHCTITLSCLILKRRLKIVIILLRVVYAPTQ